MCGCPNLVRWVSNTWGGCCRGEVQGRLRHHALGKMLWADVVLGKCWVDHSGALVVVCEAEDIACFIEDFTAADAYNLTRVDWGISVLFRRPTMY
jgi:hypothetical protein